MNYLKIIFYLFLFETTSLYSSGYTGIFQEYLIARPTPIIQLHFPYNLLPDYTTTSLSGLSTSGGTLTQGTGMAFISTSGVTGAIAVLASKARLSYQAGRGASAIFSVVFDTSVSGNSQYVGVGNAQDGFFFGYTGTNFGVLYRNNSSDTWIYQSGTAGVSGWNGDLLNTGLNGASTFNITPQFGNVYKIKYQWDGCGIIKFYVQNPSDASWVLVHTIKYPNSTGSGPSIRNPSMQLLAATINNPGVSNNVTLKVPCMAGIIEGSQSGPELYTRFSESVIKASVTGTLGNSLTIQNNLVYNGLNNQVMVFPDMLSISNPSTGAALIFKMIINPSVSGASFTNVNANSVVSFDTAGTGVTGGRQIVAAYLYDNVVQANRALNIDLSDQKISLAPGDRLVIVTESTSGTIINVGVGLSWYEKQ